MDIQIIKYHHQDLQNGVGIYFSFGADYQTRLASFNSSLQYLLRNLSPDITLKPDFLYGVEESETWFLAVSPAEGILGFGRLIHIERFEQSFGYLEDLVVRPEFRCRGLATTIVQCIIEEAREKGHYKLMLGCKPDKVEFYQQFGFAGGETSMRLNLINGGEA